LRRKTMNLKSVHARKSVWLTVCLSLLVLLALLIPAGIAWASPALVIEVFATLPEGSLPGAIAYGPQQAYWVPQLGGNAITYFQEPETPYQAPLPAENSRPYDAVVGPDKALWFTESQNGSLGRIESGFIPGGEPVTEITEYELPDAGADPNQILVGQEGGLWFTEFNANKIGFRAFDGQIEEYQLAAGARPMGISSDEKGNVWFTEWGSKSLGKITTAGVLLEIPIPGAAFRPTEMIRDQEGFIWVLFDNQLRILRIRPETAQIETFNIPSVLSSSFVDIALGVDGKIWLLGTESLGWFDNSPSGPANYAEIKINPSIFEGEGRAQLAAGPAANMLFSHNSNPNLYQVQVPGAALKDLQIIMKQRHSLILAAGEFSEDLEIVNWSRQQAEAVRVTLELDENIEFVGLSDIPLSDCALSAEQVTCLVGTIPAGGSLGLTVTYKTGRIPSNTVERQLAVSVDLDAGDYLPANNRQFRNYQIQRALEYGNDFSVQAEDAYWSHTLITPSDTASETLGRFSNENVSLTFSDLPPHDEISICFQLYIMGAWDGNQFLDPDVVSEPIPIIGPDLWVNYIDDNRLVVATFSNQARFSQSFPDNYSEGDYAAQQGARASGDFDNDGVSNDVRYDFCYLRGHTQDVFKTTFYGVNLDAELGETWSLDNVSAKIYYHDVYDWLFAPLIVR
jgi:virginiamycin B lyase